MDERSRDALGARATRECRAAGGVQGLIRSLEEATRHGEFVLSGDPSSGRTQAMIEAIAARPVISREPLERGVAANVVVVHYSAVSETAARASSLGVADILCVKTPAGFGGLDPERVCGPLLIVCLDTLFGKLCPKLARVSVQRIVFDNLESLRVNSYPVVRCEAKWFVCTPRLLDAPRPRSKSRTRREARLARSEGRVVETKSAQGFRAPKSVLYRETSTSCLMSTIGVLYKKKRTALATACLPCENLRRADAGLVLDERAVSRLGDACPVCYESAPPPACPKVVVPCCKNNFCAECIVRHLAQSRACPMCRADVEINSCTSVSERLVLRVGGIVSETRSLLSKCLREPGAKVLVVSGAGVDDSVADLMWHAEIDFVDIRGNGRTIERRLRDFSQEDRARSKVAVVRNHQLGFAPIRTPPLTHVIFAGHLTRDEQMHWASRGATANEASARPGPKTFAIQSVYDATFKVFG